jgi:hypothetical protein
MSRRHAERVLSQWQALSAIIKQNKQIQLQGDSLDTPRLVAVARYALHHDPFALDPYIGTLDSSSVLLTFPSAMG